MSQTSVQEQGLALNGQKYGLARDVVLSYVAEEKIGFGRFCSLGTDKDQEVKLPSVATDINALKNKRGIALQSHARESIQDGSIPSYQVKEMVSVMTKGMVYVEVEADVTPSSDVYVRHAADGGLDQLGIMAPAAGTGLEQLNNARFLRSSELVDGKKIAVLELL
jgi:hypothetical protein